MSDAGRVSVAYIKEVTWGTTPASALTLVSYATGESLGHTTGTTRTNALRSDYTKPQILRTQTDGGGGINFEHAYADTDHWLAGALNGAFSTTATTGAITTLSAVASTNKIHRSSGSFVSDGFLAGMWVKVSGFATTGNNGYFYLTAVAASDLTVAPTSVLADEAAGATVTVLNNGFLTNGTTVSSWTLERKFTDWSSVKYSAQKGQRVGSYSLNCQAGQINTGSVSFNGKGIVALAASTAGSGAYTAGTTNRVTTGVDNVTAIYEGGISAVTTMQVQGISFNVNSPNRPTHVLGSTDPSGIGKNSLEIGGNLTAYADNAAGTFWDKHVNYTATSLHFRVTDAGTNSIIYSFPAVRVTGGNPNAGSADSDVSAQFAWMAETDSTTGYQMMVSLC